MRDCKNEEATRLELTEERLSTVSAEEIGLTELDNVTGGFLKCTAGVHYTPAVIYCR